MLPNLHANTGGREGYIVSAVWQKMQVPVLVGDGTEGREELRQLLAAEKARRHMLDARLMELTELNERLKYGLHPPLNGT